MADPYRALLAPVMPTAPDPVFAASLRARLERALALPPGVSMSTSTSTSTTSYRHGDTGYAWLSVRDVHRAKVFFGAVLGWTTTPGSVAEGSQVEGTSPSQGLHGGQEHATLNCCYAVDDIQTAVDRVRAAGGEASEPSSAPYGLVADCRDNQGTVFAVYQPAAAVAGGERPGVTGSRQGDLVYVTAEVIDSALARAFYSAVLGWRFTPGGQPDGWQVPDTAPMTGMHGGHARATTLPMWQVDDLAAAVARVRSAGGTASDPQQRSYGLEAECADDQDTRFYLGQF